MQSEQKNFGVNLSHPLDIKLTRIFKINQKGLHTTWRLIKFRHAKNTLPNPLTFSSYI